MPKPHKNTPPAIIKKPSAVSVRPSLGQTMKEGFGLGLGMSVAQNAVNGAMNLFSAPKTSNPVENTKVQEYAQNKDFEPTRLASLIEYEKCMKYSSNDTDLCKTLLNNNIEIKH
jgi:hypothetical protein